MASAIDANKLKFEIYSNGNYKLALLVEKMIQEHFCFQDIDENSVLDIEIQCIDARPYGILDPLEGKNELDRHEKRIKLIQDSLEKVTRITACIVILPYQTEDGVDVFDEGKDPKQAIRAGFASTERLTQFLVPNDNESKEYRVRVALLDMYRQLGYVNYGDAKGKKNVNYNVPTSALHIVNYKKTPYGSISRIPLIVTCNRERGQVYVECPSLWQGKKLYREACLLFQRLATQEGKRKVKNINILVQIEEMVTKLYHMSKQPHLLMVRSDGTTRNIWKFLTDGSISEERRSDSYGMEIIWFDKEKKAYGIDTAKVKSELRIVRVRNNNEVPDYITNPKDSGFESACGMYIYNNVFYGIAWKPNEKPYSSSFWENSKMDKPSWNFKVANMIEMYPMLLQEGDQGKEWCTLVNNYRGGAHQYKWVLKNPLPMHLGELLEEYIY